jgi:DNA ligase D-like protein (predicted ligase)
MRRRLEPMLALLGESLPVGPEWSYEVKWDGYRALVEKRSSDIRVWSRRGADLTRTYPGVVAAAQTIPARDVILDGEIVALDSAGRPSFQALQHRSAAVGTIVTYYAFDLLERDRRSLCDLPLVERRRELVKAVGGSAVLLSEPLPGTPKEIAAAIRRFGLEGVIAKRLDSRYEAGQQSGAWTKVKFARRQEFVVGGYRPSGNDVDALVVGYYDGRKLYAAGKVRAGMTPRDRRDLASVLSKLKRPNCPFVNVPTSRTGRWGEGITAEDMLTLVWVAPKVVVECSFTEWTAGANLRHAAFVGLRTDKKPSEVRRE